MLRRFAALVLLCAACARQARAPSEDAHEVAWTPLPPQGASPIAQVNGTPLYAPELFAHARATDLPIKAALADWVAQELLAQEAKRRGLERQADVVWARNQVLVRKVVAQDFGEKHASPAAIPEEAALPVYQGMAHYFHHDALLRVWNVCTTPEIASAIYEDVRKHPPRTKEEFSAATSRHGAQAQSIFTETTSQLYAEAWRKAVFAALHKAGDVMPPTPLPELPFPCTTHLAYCEEYLPARDTPFAQALGEIRERIFDDWRRKSFLSWVGRLVRAHNAQLLALPEGPVSPGGVRP